MNGEVPALLINVVTRSLNATTKLLVVTVRISHGGSILGVCTPRGAGEAEKELTVRPRSP